MMAYDQQLADATAEITRLRAEIERLRISRDEWKRMYDEARPVARCVVCGGSGFVMYDAEWEEYKTRCPRCGTAEQKARLRCAECDCGDGPCNWIAEQSAPHRCPVCGGRHNIGNPCPGEARS